MRVLLTNDDGPPGRVSPYIYEFSKYLRDTLGWEVRVVIPNSQKSWIGKAFHITEIVRGVYFYPRDPDGFGETSEQPRQLNTGELDEWILLDATPATCVNIALHNLFPNQIDLVISGPNLGRNSSAAFALSSGTIGAAMSASISGTRSMALSYGTVIHPTPLALHKPAHTLACRIIDSLWSRWCADGYDSFENVGLFSINIPMISELLTPDGLPVYWTTLWRNSYGRLFQRIPKGRGQLEIQDIISDSSAGLNSESSSQQQPPKEVPADTSPLTFKFAPEFQNIIHPSLDDLPEGCDAWALVKGAASVSALAASFAEVDINEEAIQGVRERLWKL